MLLIKLNDYEQIMYKKLLEHFKGILKIPFEVGGEQFEIDIDEIELTSSSRGEKTTVDDYLNSMEFVRDMFNPTGDKFRLLINGYSIFIPALRINEHGVYYMTHKSVKYVLRNFMHITQKGINKNTPIISPFARYIEVIDKISTYIIDYTNAREKAGTKKKEILRSLVSKIPNLVFNAFEYHRELYNANQPYKTKHGNTIVNVKFGKINNLELIKPKAKVSGVFKAIEKIKEVDVKSVRIFKLDEDTKKAVEEMDVGDFKVIDKILYYKPGKSNVFEISFNPSESSIEDGTSDKIDAIRDEIYNDIKDEVLEAVKSKYTTIKYFKNAYGTHQGLYMYKFTPKVGEEFDFSVKNDPATNGDAYLDAAFWGERADIGTARLLREKGDTRSVATMNIPFLKYMASKRINVSVKNIMNHHALLYPEHPIVEADRNTIDGINLKTHIIGQGININTPHDIDNALREGNFITTEQGIKVDSKLYLEWMYRTYDAGIIISESAAKKFRYRHYTFIDIDLQKHCSKVVDIDIMRRALKNKKWNRPKDAERILVSKFDKLMNQYYTYIAYLRESVGQLAKLKKDIKTSTTYLKLRDMEEKLHEGIKVGPDTKLLDDNYSEKYGIKINIKGNANEYHVGIVDDQLVYWFEDDLKTGDKLASRTGVKGVCTVMPDDYLMGYEMIIGQNKIGKSSILKEYEKSKEHGEKITGTRNEKVEEFVNRLNEDFKKGKGRPKKYKGIVIDSINMLKEVVNPDHLLAPEDMDFILGIFKPKDKKRVVDKTDIKETEDAIEFNIKYKKRWIGGKGGKYVVEKEERTIDKNAIYLYDFLSFVTKKGLKSEYIDTLLSFNIDDIKYMEDLLKGRVSDERKWGYIFIQLQDAFSWYRTVVADKISLSDNFIEVLLSYPHTDRLMGHLFRKTDILGKKRVSRVVQHLRYIWRDIKDIDGELTLVELDEPKRPIQFKYGWRTEKADKKIKIRKLIDAVIKHPIPSYYDSKKGIDRKTYKFFIPVAEFIAEREDTLEDDDVFDVNEELEEFDKAVTIISSKMKKNPLLYSQKLLTDLPEFDPAFDNNKILNVSIKDTAERKEFVEKIKTAMQRSVDYDEWYYTKLINTHLFYYYGNKMDIIRESIIDSVKLDLEDKITDEKERELASKAIAYEITSYIEKIQRIFRTNYNTGLIVTLDRLMSGKDRLLHSEILRGNMFNGAFLTCIPRYIEKYDPPAGFNMESFLANYDIKENELKSSYVVIHSSIAKKLKLKTDDWILLAREPISSRGSIKAYKVMINDKKYPEVNKNCMLVDPGITKTYSMDFDGDTAIVVPIKDFSLVEPIYRQTLYFDKIMGLDYSDLMFGEKLDKGELYKVPSPTIQHKTKKEMYDHLTELRFDDLMKNIYGVYYLGGKRKSLALHLQYFNKMYDNKWMTMDWINVLANIERIGMHKFKEKLKSYHYFEMLSDLMNYLYKKKDEFKYEGEMLDLISDIDPDKLYHFRDMFMKCRKPFGYPSENIYRKKQHIRGGSVGRRLKYFIEEYNKKDYSLNSLEDSIKIAINNQYYNKYFDDLTNDELNDIINNSSEISSYIYNMYNIKESINELQESIEKLIATLEETDDEDMQNKIIMMLNDKKNELEKTMNELDTLENSTIKIRLILNTRSKKRTLNVVIDKSAIMCPYNNLIKRRYRRD